ncbi:biotin synthase BioB [Brassicibacter mesophilus]|uniref:biotin synthase BioB n=1 Tax=Brassicibacter mesophilus TaxID=745119 RepID=UPI003D1B864B
MDMKDYIYSVVERILDGGEITYEECIKLINIDENDIGALEVLYKGANKIRESFAGKKADLCTIMNVKSGKCSEDCKYCAQSVHYSTGVNEYSLLDYDKILERALEMESKGAHRFSLVTSGKGVSKGDLDRLADIYRKLSQQTKLKICASHGIITYEQAKRLKEAGVTMYHHNIETSREYYSKICTTHTYEDRIDTIKNVTAAGMDICCGGIIGMGETEEDRVNMILEIRNLGVHSIPVNVLNPIKGTPLETSKPLTPSEILKTMAIYRFVIPTAFIRYAGGRKALGHKQNIGFRAGVNAALAGDYLTTVGNNIEYDREMILNEGLEV